MAKEQGYAVHCLTFRYGQRHEYELEAARRVAAAGNAAALQIVEIDLSAFGGSALTTDLEVPKGRTEEEMSEGIPNTYVPARNTIFLSFALAKAEVLPARDIFIGANAVDYSGYPDCRPAFIDAYEELANRATKQPAGPGAEPIRIHAPLLHMKKSEIILEGQRLGVDYGMTLTCYDPAKDLACGQCDACALRRRGFQEAGVADPTRYLDR
jgi:7-cyano-7-deazaguanine synthase